VQPVDEHGGRERLERVGDGAGGQRAAHHGRFLGGGVCRADDREPVDLVDVRRVQLGHAVLVVLGTFSERVKAERGDIDVSKTYTGRFVENAK
jgi:hypothetical protein